MFEIYEELKKSLKKEKITLIDFCKNTLKKSRTSIFRLFKEKRTRSDLSEDERGILQTIESWIVSKNQSSVLEFSESSKRNKLNIISSNNFPKNNFNLPEPVTFTTDD